jgi:putative NADH-flavin reductase
MVSDAKGNSSIGVEDYAIASVDELENPRFHGGLLTVGY